MLLTLSNKPKEECVGDCDDVHFKSFFLLSLFLFQVCTISRVSKVGFCTSYVMGDGFHVGSRAQEKLIHTSTPLNSWVIELWQDGCCGCRKTVPRWPRLPCWAASHHRCRWISTGWKPKETVLTFSVCGCSSMNCVDQAVTRSDFFCFHSNFPTWILLLPSSSCCLTNSAVKELDWMANRSLATIKNSQSLPINSRLHAPLIV